MDSLEDSLTDTNLDENAFDSVFGDELQNILQNYSSQDPQDEIILSSFTELLGDEFQPMQGASNFENIAYPDDSQPSSDQTFSKQNTNLDENALNSVYGNELQNILQNSSHQDPQDEPLLSSFTELLGDEFQPMQEASNFENIAYPDDGQPSSDQTFSKQTPGCDINTGYQHNSLLGNSTITSSISHNIDQHPNTNEYSSTGRPPPPSYADSMKKRSAQQSASYQEYAFDPFQNQTLQVNRPYTLTSQQIMSPDNANKVSSSQHNEITSSYLPQNMLPKHSNAGLKQSQQNNEEEERNLGLWNAGFDSINPEKSSFSGYMSQNYIFTGSAQQCTSNSEYPFAPLQQQSNCPREINTQSRKRKKPSKQNNGKNEKIIKMGKNKKFTKSIIQSSTASTGERKRHIKKRTKRKIELPYLFRIPPNNRLENLVVPEEKKTIELLGKFNFRNILDRDCDQVGNMIKQFDAFKDRVELREEDNQFEPYIMSKDNNFYLLCYMLELIDDVNFELEKDGCNAVNSFKNTLSGKFPEIRAPKYYSTYSQYFIRKRKYILSETNGHHVAKTLRSLLNTMQCYNFDEIRLSIFSNDLAELDYDDLFLFGPVVSGVICFIANVRKLWPNQKKS